MPHVGLTNPREVTRQKLLSELKDPSVKAAFARASKDLEISASEVRDLFLAASADRPSVPGDTTTPTELADLQKIRTTGASLLSQISARTTFDKKLDEVKARARITLSDDDGGLRSEQTSVDRVGIRGTASGFVYCPPGAMCIGAPSTFRVEVDGKSYALRPTTGESAASLAGRMKTLLEGAGYSAKTQTVDGTTYLSVGKAGATSPVAVGSWQALSGTIDNRTLFGPGGEAPPSGSYLVLDKPITVNGKRVKDVYLQGEELAQGAKVSLNGRVDIQTYGGVEVHGGSVVALSGISNLTAGEPRFDGKKFTNALGKELAVLSYVPPMIMDIPARIFVLDEANDKAFIGSMGGFIPPQMNPFHGFRGSAAIADPTDADRAKIRFDAAGNPISKATNKKLALIGSTGDTGPVHPDMQSSKWYLDAASKTIYRFVSGGIAGFHNTMFAVIKLPGDVSPL